jgi:AAA+ ATPase superfamily predicted ATPase
MFVGRERELKKLNDMYGSGKFEFAVVYGRRRVGKTTLINEFCRGKRTMFYTAFESTSEDNRAGLSRSFFHLTEPRVWSSPVFNDFTDIMDRIDSLSRTERLVLVIDEYPWLAEAEPAISSLLQQYIDHVFKDGKLFLILCGSSMSFMENQVLGHKSPLFGRRTAQFRVLPFDYRETALFHPSFAPEDNALVYGITGGVPLYVSYFSDSASMEENVARNFFEPNSPLFEEPSNLLKQELREPKTYNAILSAIAGGATRMNEIATKVGCESGPCAKYLSSLAELGIVERISPLTEPNSRKTIYKISDLLFAFWYRFVPHNLSSITTGRTDDIWDYDILRYLPDYMGAVFEKMAMDYLLKYKKTLPLDVGLTGRWWGNDPERREQTDIDLVIFSHDEKKALFGECKYRNEKTGPEVLKELERRSLLLTGPQQRFYALFSKAGFTPAALKSAKSTGASAVTLEEMYR